MDKVKKEKKFKNNKHESSKNEKVEIEFKDINEDFSKEIEENKKIIILVVHSKSYAMEYTFKTYINKRFQFYRENYVVAIAHKEFINPDELKPSNVEEILKKDLNEVYNDFKNRYPEAYLEKPFSFNYAIDYNEKTKKGEIMSVTVMKINDEFSKTQISPIVALSSEQYNMLMGKDDSDEGRLLYEIITEKRMGIEQFGLIGYLTDGKFKTYDMYMEGLIDLTSEYKNLEKYRPKLLEYKKYRTTKKTYLFSIKTEEEKQEYNDEENDLIV